jgi:PAS domain S-box-containing protein
MGTLVKKTKHRFIAFVMIAVILVLAILHITLYFLTRDALERHMLYSVQGIAIATARTVEQDLDRYFAFLEDRDIGSDYYTEKNLYFATIKKSGALTYIYTLRAAEDGTLEYILDGEPIGSENWSAPGSTTEEWDHVMREVYAGSLVGSHGLMTDTEWGRLMSAYAAIYGHGGEVVGIVGADISGEYFNSYLNRIQLILFIVYAGVLLAVFISVTHYSGIVANTQERLMLMLDSSPLCTQIWSKSLEPIDCNEAAVRLYNLKGKEAYLERFIAECSPEFQPDGQRSDEKAVVMVRRAFESGFCKFEWTHRIPDLDEDFPAEVTLVKATYKKQDVVIGYTRDLREYSAMMKALTEKTEQFEHAAWEAQEALTLRNKSLLTIENILNNIDAGIYATIPETGELLFVNTYLKNMFGIEGDDAIGKLCYKVFRQGFEEKCDFCPCIRLEKEPDKFIRWEEHIPGYGSVLHSDSYITWHDGRTVHLQHAIDITEIVRTRESLKARDDMLLAVNKVAALLLTTNDAENIGAPLVASMELVGLAIDADRVHIWRNETTDGKLKYMHAYEWLSDLGRQKTTVPMTLMTPYDKMDEWESKFRRGEIVGGPFSKLSPSEQEYFGGFDVKTVLLIPLFLDEEFWGLVSIDDCSNEREYSEEELAILRSVSLMMANAINRRALIDKRTYESAKQAATLATLLDSIPDIIFTKDITRRFTLCNKAFLNHFGKSGGEILGKNSFEALGLPDEVGPSFTEKNGTVMREGEERTYEENLPRCDGSNPLFETTVVPLTLNGESIGIVGIARDITARKELETEMKARYLYANRLSDALSTITKAHAVSDGDLKATADFVAEIGCVVMGVRSIGIWRLCGDQALLQNISTYYSAAGEYTILDDYDLSRHPEYIERLKSERLIAIDSADECKLMIKGGGLYGNIDLCAALDAPIHMDGKLAGVVFIAQDICEQYPKKREWTIEEQNFASSLADIMALAISSFERLESREAAELANRAKSSFLANMSHEIRTPMNSIVGFSELALDDDIPPRTKEYLTKIRDNSGWLLQIINDILDISKVESGKMEMENVPFNLRELLSSTRALIAPKAREKGIDLLFYAEPSTGKTPLGDPTRLRQVLINLLSNAVKFTDSGKISLKAAVKEITDNTLTIYVEVKDTGIGMSPAQLDRIFIPFMQAESGTTRKYGGSGLGLSITKTIIEMMGGQLSVESEPGAGSKFSFELTFDTIDETGFGETLLQSETVFDEIKKPVFNGEVLLCEDSTMNQQVICEHLSRVGLRTVVADNGQAGVDAVKERIQSGGELFGLIFMDIHMPVMDGIEATAKIRGLNAEIPIVAMTANIMSHDKELYASHGMNGYVGKPFTSQELWRCLMKYFPVQNYELTDEQTQKVKESKTMVLLKTQFVKYNQNAYEEITALLEAGDIKTAHRRAHTLKSNAGQLSLKALQRAAAVVENGLSAGENLLEEETLRSLQAELKSALDELMPLVREAVPKQTVGADETRKLLDKLEPLLRDKNTECFGLLEELRAVPGAEGLMGQIEEGRFKQALTELAALREGLEA